MSKVSKHKMPMIFCSVYTLNIIVMEGKNTGCLGDGFGDSDKSYTNHNRLVVAAVVVLPFYRIKSACHLTEDGSVHSIQK